MIFMKETPRNAGVTLWGDSISLIELHKFTYKCWDAYSINNKGFKDCLFGFSFDVRKAYEGAREQNYIEDFGNNKVPIYGVKISWVFLLISINFMRSSMAYIETSKKEQSIIYNLEYYLEQILHEQFPKTSKEILKAMEILTKQSQEDLCEKLGSRESYFLNLSSKAKRTNELLTIMKSFISLVPQENLLAQSLLDMSENYPEKINW